MRLKITTAQGILYFIVSPPALPMQQTLVESRRQASGNQKQKITGAKNHMATAGHRDRVNIVPIKAVCFDACDPESDLEECSKSNHRGDLVVLGAPLRMF